MSISGAHGPLVHAIEWPPRQQDHRCMGVHWRHTPLGGLLHVLDTPICSPAGPQVAAPTLPKHSPPPRSTLADRKGPSGCRFANAVHDLSENL